MKQQTLFDFLPAPTVERIQSAAHQSTAENAPKLKLTEQELRRLIKKKTCGCPLWGFNFKHNCTECKATGEREPDEAAENLFRCDYEFKDCASYKLALEVAT